MHFICRRCVIKMMKFGYILFHSGNMDMAIEQGYGSGNLNFTRCFLGTSAIFGSVQCTLKFNCQTNRKLCVDNF
jgi:hypothetical protein